MTFRTPGIILICTLALGTVACGDFGGGGSGTTSGPQQLLGAAGSAGGVAAFSATLSPIVTTYCIDCHDSTAPRFAHTNVNTAYQAVIPVVNLGSPGNSGIVDQILSNHNCWVPDDSTTGLVDCAANAAEITAAIAEWADIIDFGEGGVSISESLSSGSLSLAQGVEDLGSERYMANAIAFYDFTEGTGDTVFDRSGYQTPLNLAIEGDVEWMSANGVVMGGNDGGARLRATAADSAKLYDAIADPQTGTGQYTVEAWITNANITQTGPARIVTYSRTGGSRNFTLGQRMYQYIVRNRALIDTGSNENNGEPEFQTYDMDEDAQDRLQHVVATYDQFRGRRIYVDGVWTDDVDETPVGHLWNWERANQRFAMGDEVNANINDSNRRWQGQLRMVTIYNQALTEGQIVQNYQAGVGRRRLLRFDVSQWTAPGSSVEFTVSELDNYSYMFCSPVYRTANPTDFRLANLRIAVHDAGEPAIALTGQAFYTLDVQVTGSQQELSRQCAVIPKVNGPESDIFTLVFEHLNGFQNLIVHPDPGPLDVLIDDQDRPLAGLRNFERINESMAEVTGIDSQTPGPREAYRELVQQLPSTVDLPTFVSSQQVGIAKLALEYCDALVDRDVNDGGTFFGTFPFGSVAETALASGSPNRTILTDVLYDRMVGDDALTEQPDRVDVAAHMDALYDSFVGSCPCSTTDTENFVKGACAAVLSSGAMSIH